MSDEAYKNDPRYIARVKWADFLVKKERKKATGVLGSSRLMHIEGSCMMPTDPVFAMNEVDCSAIRGSRIRRDTLSKRLIS